MGGKTSTSGQGRKKGVPNKVTADVRALAGKYTDDAMRELGRLALEAESEAARVAAIKELFDRAFGKASQSVAVSGPGGGPVVTRELSVHVAGLSKARRDAVRAALMAALGDGDG